MRFSILHSKALFYFAGIRVQFESAIRVIDETNTCDDGFSINPKYFNTLIAGSFEAKENQFYYSPIAAQINGLSDGDLRIFILNKY